MPPSNEWPLYDPDGAWEEWELLHPDPVEQGRVAAFFRSLRENHGFFPGAFPVLKTRDELQAFLPDPSQVWVQWGIDEAGESLYVIHAESLHDADFYDPDEGPKELPDE